MDSGSVPALKNRITAMSHRKASTTFSPNKSVALATTCQQKLNSCLLSCFYLEDENKNPVDHTTQKKSLRVSQEKTCKQKFFYISKSPHSSERKPEGSYYILSI